MIALSLLILIAGLRWRIGGDTVVYAREFYYAHDILGLTKTDFASVQRMPLWVLLNATCKTLWNNFLLVQFVVALFNISVIGCFIKKTCPSLRFFILFCYFIGMYKGQNMEFLRESISVGFFLLTILAFNNNNILKSILFSFLAVMSHVFAFVPVLLFISVYYFFPRKEWIRFGVYCILFFITLFFPATYTSLVANSMYFLDGQLASNIENYANSDVYGSVNKSVVQYISLICQIGAYLFMFYKYRNTYYKYITLKRDIFESGLVVFIIILLCRFAFVILHRVGTTYFYFWGCYLAVVFTKIIINRTKSSQRLALYMIMLIVPMIYALHGLLVNDVSYKNNKMYMRYYPYSSVFDKTLNSDRERIHEIHGAGYSRTTDY